jgi:outer membrane protein OmpA-like peptidoglycan-associated protein
MLVAASATAGESRHGWYIGLDVGLATIEQATLDTPAYAALDFVDSGAALGVLGFAFDNHVRLEIEAGYRENDLDAVNGVSVSTGQLSEWSAIANLRYDIPVASRWDLEFGAGAGVDRARFTDHFGTSDSDTTLALQLLAGVVHELSPHWDLNLTYRFLKANDATFLIAGAERDMDMEKHTVTVGLRYGYDAPPPAPIVESPPPPPPPPAAPKQFIVFFGFNKCNITAEADAVLSEAASAAKSSGSASVRIVGHTDTVGSAEYNQKLSECRADAAKSNLVGKGVSEGAISTSGKGEAELMVQTGDGVKEPQNRRATVDLQ